MTCISCILIIRTYNSVTLNKGAFAISNLYRTLFFMGIRCALRSFQPVVTMLNTNVLYLSRPLQSNYLPLHSLMLQS